MQENIINSLLIKCDSNKQYSQRSCLHIHDIESDNKNGLEKVKKMLQFVGFTFCRKKLTYHAGLVKNTRIEILEKKLNLLLSSANCGNFGNNCTAHYLKFSRREQVKILLFQSI